jgi:hypothetical protein
MADIDPLAARGPLPNIGIPNSQDYARLVFAAPYFDMIPIAEMIEPAAIEAIEAALPSLVAPYVDQAAEAAVQRSAVLLTGSAMSGPLLLSPLLPTADSMAATKAYVDTMISTAGVPEVPTVPVGQSWVRQVGQWVPLSTSPGGPFLPLSGGVMQGQINMSGNAITNLPAIPVFPNGAAPATWVLNQIASVSLYQGVWNLDTMTPDLTSPSRQINGYTWIAITNAPAGVVVGPAVPGLQGMTVYNGDTVIFSAAQGNFSAIHAGGLTAPQADARYVMLTGSQMSGPLLLSTNAVQPTQAVTLQQLNAFVPPGSVGEAPNDGQIYGRNGVTKAWTPSLPLAGGVLTGSLSLAGNATANLQPVTLQQQTASIATAVSGYVPLAGGVTMTGLLSLSGNAGSALNPVPLQQVNAMLGSYLPLAGGSTTGPIAVNRAIPAGGNAGSVIANSNITATNYAVNGYINAAGTGWNHLTGTGTVGIFNYDPAANTFNWFTSPQAAAGAAVATPVSIMDLNNAGLLTLRSPGQAGINLRKSGSTQTSFITGTSGANATRWLMYLGDASPESGGNQGSDFAIWRYTDAGANFPAAALSITRANGAVTLNPPGDGVRINTPAATNCRIYYNVTGVKLWSVGETADGSFMFNNETDAISPLLIAPNGNSYIRHSLPITNNAYVSGGFGNNWQQVNSYAFNNASAKALKTDIAEVPAGALAQVASLKTKHFRWKDGEQSERLNTGFVAEEVAAALGDDFGGYKHDEEFGMHGLDYAQLTAVLWKAVQELAEKVGALEARA